jgi:hypothetical protein
VKAVKKHNFKHDAKVISAGAKQGGKALQVIGRSGLAGKYGQQVSEAGDALRMGGQITSNLIKR